jgi:hypothetical protein
MFTGAPPMLHLLFGMMSYGKILSNQMISVCKNCGKKTVPMIPLTKISISLLIVHQIM